MEFPSKSLTEACIIAWITFLFFSFFLTDYKPGFSSSIIRKASRLISCVEVLSQARSRVIKFCSLRVAYLCHKVTFIDTLCGQANTTLFARRLTWDIKTFLQIIVLFLEVSYSIAYLIFWKWGNSILKWSRCSVSVWERAPSTSKGLSMLVIFLCWGQKVPPPPTPPFQLWDLSLARNNDCIKSGRQNMQRNATWKHHRFFLH